MTNPFYDPEGGVRSVHRTGVIDEGWDSEEDLYTLPAPRQCFLKRKRVGGNRGPAWMENPFGSAKKRSQIGAMKPLDRMAHEILEETEWMMRDVG